MKKILSILFLICTFQTAFADAPSAPPDPSVPSSPAQPTHGFSVFGKLKYLEDFTHYDYTNPNAPKGGTLRLGILGNFDSLNPFIVKGIHPAGILMTMATLLDEARDRSGESYAYAAASMELAPDRSWVIFCLNPQATFSNGDPVTADDVIWVFETLKTKGLPMYRTYYKDVSAVEKLDDHTIKFMFSATTNRELPGILGQLPILSKKYYTTRDFAKTSLTPPPSSGPYAIDSISTGHSIAYKRVKKWWGSAIPSQRGRHNFDRIKYDYYMDNNALFEGFKAGQYDMRQENIAKNWAHGYEFAAVKEGRIQREELKHSLSSGTQGIFFNTRRPLFKDVRVRKALTLLLDFPWINKNLFYGLYARNTSYYPNSDFEAKGAPSAKEKAILEPFQDQLTPEVLTAAFTLPTPQTEDDRRALQTQAQDLLKEAGYEIRNGTMVNVKTGDPFAFEFLIYDKPVEKIALSFAESLKRIGINLKVRNLDATTYQQRVLDLNFDSIFAVIPQSASLGNEQRDWFGSERANMPGTYNFAGIHNPVVDQLIEQLIISKSYGSLVTHSKALDRVLLVGYYIIPAWRSPVIMVAYWNRFSRPEIIPKYNALEISAWWFDSEKDAKLTQAAPKKTMWRSLWDWIRGWFA